MHVLLKDLGCFHKIPTEVDCGDVCGFVYYSFLAVYVTL